MTSHLKARSSSSGQQNIETSHCCTSEAKIFEFVRLVLCRCPPPTPQPKRYLSPNTFEVGQVTERQPFMRMRPLKRKQESGLSSVCDVVFMDGGMWIPTSLILGEFGGGEIQGQSCTERVKARK